MADEPKLNQSLIEAGVSPSYASLIANGKRAPSLPLAIKIFRHTGLKFGPLQDATDAEIDAAEKLRIKRLSGVIA